MRNERPDSDVAGPIRTLHGLRRADIAALSTGLGGLPGVWSVETHQDYEGDLTVLLVPAGGDEAGPSFVVYRQAGAFRVAVSRWDAYDPLGAVPVVEAVLPLIQACLRPGGAQGPAPGTRAAG
ncbi:MAG TPA: hypothetical protein VMI52_13005 [Acetobacteraceae bacterium]|nr:hypothetical protein [Acetobacteraceae bacterium]